MNFLNIFAWFHTRFKLGYNHIGSIFTIFNFAGILTLLFEKSFKVDTKQMVIIFALLGIFLIIVYAHLMFRKGNMATREKRAEGLLNEYWTRKLAPANRQVLLSIIDGLEKNDFTDLKRRIKENDFTYKGNY